MKVIFLFFLLFILFPYTQAQEQNQTPKKQEELVSPDEEYRTPRAGETLRGSLLGLDIVVPSRDRDKTTAISLGMSIYTSELNEDTISPYFAFYHTNTWEEKRRRLRMIIAVLANYIQFYDGTWNGSGFEFSFTWENYTIPFSTSLVVEDEELEDSKIYWGTVRAGLGFGWRTRIAPFEHDSYFSLYAYYEPGLLYFDDTDDTATNYLVPPTTYEERIKLRIRLDTMERNLMEMRHKGIAFGVDFVRGHRYKWRDHSYDGSFRKKNTESYYILSGFFTWAGGPDFLSERHRFVFSMYGGASFGKGEDRYSAFRLGGGPGGDETDALERLAIPGAKLDEFITRHYLLFSMEYRFELLFFMYLHIKGVIGPVRRLELRDNVRQVAFTETELVATIGAAITTGFIWESQLYFEYVHDWGVIKTRNRNSGDSFLISWSKSF